MDPYDEKARRNMNLKQRARMVSQRDANLELKKANKEAKNARKAPEGKSNKNDTNTGEDRDKNFETVEEKKLKNEAIQAYRER